jgi:hypothetical protein
MVLSEVSSSEKTPLAPNTSVTTPTRAPTPRAFWCDCMLFRVSSRSDRDGAERTSATEATNFSRLAASPPMKNPRATTATRRSGKMENSA